MAANPASEIMRDLPERIDIPATPTSSRVRVKLVQRPDMPVSWSYIHANIPNMLDDIQPDLVLHIGLYSRRPSLWSIEYSAPLHGFTAPDVDGRVWQSQAAEVPGHPGVQAADMPKSLHTSLDHTGIARQWQVLCEALTTDIEQSDQGPRRTTEWKADVGPTDGVGAFLCGFSYCASLAHYYLRRQRVQVPRSSSPRQAESGRSEKSTGGPVLFLHTPECPTEAHVKLGNQILINLLQAMVESYLSP